MKRNVLFVMATLIAAGAAFAQNPSAAELLRRVDENEIYATLEYEGQMINEYRGRRYVKDMKVWARGDTDSYIEFTNREDRGTKYLKTEGQIWTISPDLEEEVRITGKALKESMMGSALSFEDTVENTTLSSRYTPAVSGSEVRAVQSGNRDCWILDLTAKAKTETYPKQRLWIDKENGDVLRQELFAASGAKSKEFSLLGMQLINGRRFPVEYEVRDLIGGYKTTLTMKNVLVDRPIAASVFTKRQLSRTR